MEAAIAEMEAEIREDGSGEVVLGRGPTPVKKFMRLRLQKFVPSVSPQPLVRVMITVLHLK